MNWYKNIIAQIKIAQAVLEKTYYAVKIFKKTPDNPKGKYVTLKIFEDFQEAENFKSNIPSAKIVNVPEKVYRDFEFRKQPWRF